MNLRICSIYSTHEFSRSPTSYIRYKKLKCRTSEVHVQKLSNLIEIGTFYIRNYVFALHILHMSFFIFITELSFQLFCVYSCSEIALKECEVQHVILPCLTISLLVIVSTREYFVTKEQVEYAIAYLHDYNNLVYYLVQCLMSLWNTI